MLQNRLDCKVLLSGEAVYKTTYIFALLKELIVWAHVEDKKFHNGVFTVYQYRITSSIAFTKHWFLPRLQTKKNDCSLHDNASYRIKIKAVKKTIVFYIFIIIS